MSHEEQADAAFDDAYRSARILAGDDPATLPDPYRRSSTATTRSKRSKPPPADAGGGAGGFLPEDGNDDDGAAFAGGGGFLPEDDDEAGETHDPDAAPISKPHHLVLSAVPDALANLGLPSNDPDVLDLFASTAYLPPSASRRRNAPGAAAVEKVVGRDEFRQVVAVLLSQRPHSDASKSLQQEAGSSRRPTRRAARKTRGALAEEAGGGDDDDDSAEEFQDPDGDSASELSQPDDDDDDEVDYATAATSSPSKRRERGGHGKKEDRTGAAGGVRRKRRKAAATSSPSPSDDDDDAKAGGTTKLSADQRDQALAAFELFLERLPAHSGPSNPAARRIGFRDIQTIAGVLGEKLSDKDIEEMLSVASSLFAPASSASATRLSAQRAREAAQGAASAFAQGPMADEREKVTVGIDEFAGVLVKAKLL